MRKYIYLIIVLTLLDPISSFSQNVDYNAIILPSEIDNIDIEEKLVRLSWENYPANEVAQHEVLKAKHSIVMANSSWLNMVTIQGNLNEFNIDPSANPNNNNFFPRYNIGIRIPLGIFTETSNNVKIAKEDYKISQLNLNQQKLTLRAEVLKRYQNYLSTKELFKISSEAENDAYNSYLLIEEQFKSGEINASQFMGTSKLYNDQRAIKTRSELLHLESIIALEEIIGVKLEDIK